MPRFLFRSLTDHTLACPNAAAIGVGTDRACGLSPIYNRVVVYDGAGQMTLPHPLPDSLVELIARRFRVLGEPMRIRILEQLRLHGGEATVQELVEATGATQQNVSKHLGLLLQAGIVGRRKAGTHVYYRIVDPGVFDLCEQVCGSLERQLEALGQALGAAAAQPPRA